jgi:hypothetical protein
MEGRLEMLLASFLGALPQHAVILPEICCGRKGRKQGSRRSAVRWTTTSSLYYFYKIAEVLDKLARKRVKYFGPFANKTFSRFSLGYSWRAHRASRAFVSSGAMRGRLFKKKDSWHQVV